MSGKRYTGEFKIVAVKQVTERGFSVNGVAQRLGITTHSLDVFDYIEMFYNPVRRHGSAVGTYRL